MNPTAKFVALTFATLSAFGLLVDSMNVHAAGDLTKQQPVEMTVQLGNEKNELRFFPSNINIETGKLKRLLQDVPVRIKSLDQRFEEFSRNVENDEEVISELNILSFDRVIIISHLCH